MQCNTNNSNIRNVDVIIRTYNFLISLGGKKIVMQVEVEISYKKEDK